MQGRRIGDTGGPLHLVNLSCSELIPLVRLALDNGANVRLTATGSSMIPFLRNGDVVELEKVPPEALRHGDVVLVERPEGGYVLHRMLQIRGAEVFIAGDAGQRDGWMPVANVLARVRAVSRKGSWKRLDTASARSAGLVWARMHFITWPLLKLAIWTRQHMHRLSEQR